VFPEAWLAGGTPQGFDRLKGESLIDTQPSFFQRIAARVRSRFVCAAGSEEKRSLGCRLHDLHTRIHHIQSQVLQFIKEASGYRVVRVFRRYSAFSIVASSALLVSASNFSQENGAPGLLSGYADGAQAAEAPVKHRIAAQVSRKDNLSFVPLASATNAVDPEAKDESTLFDIQSPASLDPLALSAWSGSYPKDGEDSGDVKVYTVVSGDTVSGIATKFGITVNTILWANDIDNVDAIKPGDQIFILPVAGLSHTISSGDTIDGIAAKYKADKEKIISFNGLPANGELRVGDSIMIPDGKKDEPVRTIAPAAGLERRQYATSAGGTASDVSGYKKLDGKAGTGHRFPFGWCTWYVAQKRYVPWGGNAGTWLYHAKSMGYKTGHTPAVGSIMVTTEDRRYGHVALVEKVSGDAITVSEMNYVKWGKVNRRTLSASSRAIKGFIY
jgi:surface antigen